MLNSWGFAKNAWHDVLRCCCAGILTGVQLKKIVDKPSKFYFNFFRTK
jgi:hypothetical protein